VTIQQQPIPLTEALRIIRESLKNNGETPPAPLPQQLDRCKIARMVSVFQPRQLEGRYAEDEAHIKTLASAIGSPQRPTLLDPITVWWGGDRWYVVDGHHRLKAYEKVGLATGIPVDVFRGSLDEAMAHSAAANSKDRLGMRLDDKLNAAWRLVVVSGLSKSQIVAACAVSNGTVGNMRKIKDMLLNSSEHSTETLGEVSWREAKLEADGNVRDPNFDPSEAVKRRAEAYRRSLIRAMGDRPFVDTEGFGLALLSLDARLPEKLMQSDVWFPAVRQTLANMKTDALEAADISARIGLAKIGAEVTALWDAAEADSDY